MRVTTIALIVAASACEADLAKLQRLEVEKSIQCLNEQFYTDKYTRARPARLDSTTVESDSLARMVSHYRAKCELLTRQYEAVGR